MNFYKPASSGRGAGFSLPDDDALPGFRVEPRPPGADPDLHLAKDPIRCSGPNSACSEFLPAKRRPNGIFRDLENPPMRLCPKCFEKTFGRPGMGDDTRLILPGSLKPPGGPG